MSSNDGFVDHYKQYLPIYRDLAEVSGGNTVWIPTDSHSGWYVSSSVTDESAHSEAWERGFPNKSRPSILPDDLSPDIERTAYTTISYAPREKYQTKYYRVDEDGISWMDGDSDRLPEYGDLCAWALFVDIDIGKQYKTRPLPDSHKEVIEERLSLWVDAFTTMTGDQSHVKLLDSGGGMYVFVPPTALAPIAREYDRDDLDLIFNELGSRMRTVTKNINNHICDADNYPKELFSADEVQNKNRQFKTIGSIHKSFDAVVHPVNPDDISVTHLQQADVDDAVLQNAQTWVDEFTDDTHEEAVEKIVNYLFQGKFTKRDDINLEPINGAGWKDILDNWLEQMQERIHSREEFLERQKDIDEEELNKELTQDDEVARAAVSKVNNRKLKKYIVDAVGVSRTHERSGNEEMDFFPFWRAGQTESGRSAFYDFYEGKARFTDKSDGTSRGIVYLVALEMTYDDKNYPDVNMIDHPSEDLSGSDYARAIDELRSRGENIPFLLPNREKLDEQDVIRAGKEVGTITDSDTQPNRDGYGQEVTNLEAWNDTLDKFDEQDIKHDLARRDPLTEEKLVTAKKVSRLGISVVPSIDSPEHAEKLLNKKPDGTILFYTEAEIAGSKPDVAMVGSVGKREDGKLTIYRLIPVDLGLDNINSVSDLPQLETPLEVPEEDIQVVSFSD